MYGSIFSSKKTSETVTLIAIFVILSLLLPLLSIDYLAYSSSGYQKCLKSKRDEVS